MLQVELLHHIHDHVGGVAKERFVYGLSQSLCDARNTFNDDHSPDGRRHLRFAPGPFRATSRS